MNSVTQSRKFTGYRDKHGRRIYEGDKVSAWLSAPWDSEQPIERFFIVRKEGGQWFCDGVESNDENNFLKEFTTLEVQAR